MDRGLKCLIGALALSVFVGVIAGPAGAAGEARAEQTGVFERSFASTAWLPVPTHWNSALERRLLDQAQHGDAEAAFTLGLIESWIPWTGQKYQHQDARAVGWFEQAAAHGHPHAQYLLGMARALGKGCTQDWQAAGKALTAAAQQDHLWALAALGALHEQGLVAEADPATARRLYRRAGEMGNTWAMVRLGHMALAGRGGPKAPDEARRLFEVAAGQQDADAQLALGRWLVEDRATLTPGIRLLAAAAEAGKVPAQRLLADMYASGRQVPRDAALATTYLDMAARQGDVEAAVRLARHFATGDGVPRSATGAFRWLKAAAAHGHPGAQFDLAVAWEGGQGTPGDAASAYYWYALAAEQGVKGGQAALARLARRMAPATLSATRLRVAEALEQAEKRAGALQDTYDQAGRRVEPASLRWHRLAAEGGGAEQQYQMGLRLKGNSPVPGQSPEALQWFRRAARAGHAKAIEAFAQHLHPESDLAADEVILRAAAEAGVERAQTMLGTAYLHGHRALPKREADGERWLAAAVAAGSDHAALQLAHHCFNAPARGAEGMTWLLAAAEMGFAIAHAELGQRYAEGRFVARSLPRAYFWYTVGASQAHPAAIAGQRTLAGQLTEAERQAADDEAAAWLARWAKAHPNGPVVKRLYGPVAR